MNNDAALMDAVARFHRGELAGADATAVRAFLDSVAKIASEHEQSRAAYERTLRRFDLQLEAELAAVEAKKIARRADELRIQADRA